MKRILALLLPAAATLTAACAGGDELDVEAYKADYAPYAGDADWDALIQLHTETCEKDEDAFQLFIEITRNLGYPADEARTWVRHFCPERLDEVEKVLNP